MPFVNHRVVRDALDECDMSTEQLAATVKRNLKTLRNVVGAHQVTRMGTVVQIAKALNLRVEVVTTWKNRAEQDAEAAEAA